MPRLKDVVSGATRRLAAAGVPSPGSDAQLLVAHALGLSRPELARRIALGAEPDPDEQIRIDGLVEQRERRVPLQHLTGSAPFRGIELAVGPGVFVPRVETELLAGLAAAAAAQASRAGRTPLVADLCTGSGAIALAVADEVPAARVVAVELDPQALAWAARNVERLGASGRVELRPGDAVGSDTGVLADLAGTVDVVVANPPYIPPSAAPLEPEVRDHDPALALYGGGDDGLATARGVVAAAAGLLRAGGLLVMEHADQQGRAARALLVGRHWSDVVTRPDLAGRDRAVVAVRTSAPRRGG